MNNTAYDVIIAGAGIAGISSALACARNGAKAMLIEREWMPGGLATLGLVAMYLPLCNGFGRQVSFGIAEELLRLSIKGDKEAQGGLSDWLSGNITDLKGEKGRYETLFNPWLFALRAEEMLINNGVKILYGSVITGAETENGIIKSVTVHNKSGFTEYKAVNFIDCTGDADLCAMSGAKTALFERKNVLAAWYFAKDKSGENRLHMFGGADVTEKMEKEGFRAESLSDRRFTGVGGEENSEMMLLSHKTMLRDIENHILKDEKFAPTAISSIPLLRKTRRLVGITQADSDPEFYPEDCIGVISNWRERGPCYALPYTSLYGSEIKNLAAAGRCISVTDDLWEYTRVIPACAVTGEAAGVAAAMGKNFADVPVNELQNKLKI